MGQRCWWFLLIFATACFSPQFDDSKLQCGPNSLCPPGFECQGDVCVSPAAVARVMAVPATATSSRPRRRS